MRRGLAASLLGLAMCGSALGAASSTACAGPVTLRDVGSDGRIGAKWNAATSSLAYGRVDRASGHFHTFVADAEGEHEERLTAPQWRADRHQFPAAWHPSGDWLALLVEKPEHERSSVDALPGYGAYTDYWLLSRASGKAWKLYELPAGYDHALTHAAFSPDGSKFVWTERVGAPHLFDRNLFAGSYVFKVADFVACRSLTSSTC